MRVRCLGIVDEADVAALHVSGRDPLDAMPTGSEGPQRIQSRIKVCSRSEHQRERSQRVGKQMRVDCTVRFAQMTEFGDFSHSVRDTRHRSGDTGELDPIEEEIPEGIDYAIRADPPIDPEAIRYAPQPPPRFIWVRRLLVLAVISWLRHLPIVRGFAATCCTAASKAGRVANSRGRACRRGLVTTTGRR